VKTTTSTAAYFIPQSRAFRRLQRA